MSKRIVEYDVLRGIGILLVIIGHTRPGELVNLLIYSFHMPIFYFISGSLYNGRANIGKKFKSIMIPFYIFSLLSFCFWIFKQFYYKFDGIPLYGPLLGTLYGANASHFLEHNLPLWFLPSLFSMYLLFNIFSLTNFNVKLFLGVSFLFMYTLELFDIKPMLPMGLSQTLLGIPFFVIGYKFKKYDFSYFFKKYYNTWFVMLLFILWVLLVLYNQRVDMQSLTINNPVLFVGNALLGIMLLLSIIYKFKIENNLLITFGRYSLYIFTTQMILLLIIKGIFQKIELEKDNIFLLLLIQVFAYYIYFFHLHKKILKIKERISKCI